MTTAGALFLEQATRLADRPALRTLVSGGADADAVITWGAWADMARAFAGGLIAGGFTRGDTVAILAGNRIQWPVADLGAVLAGCVGVGIYPTAAVTQIAHVLRDSGAAVVVVDTADQLARVEAALEGATDRPVLIAPAGAAAGRPEVRAWEAWLEEGRAALEDGGAVELARRIRRARPEEVALLIYTSGSTGEPKGARIPHSYLLASAASIRDTFGFTSADTSLSFLPFCHAAERVFGLYTRILCGMECALVPDHTRLRQAALEYGPTVFGGLPRFYEKAYEALEAERQAAPAAERQAWDRALELGRARSRSIRKGRGSDAATEAAWKEIVGPFRERLSAHFGGRVRVATSGGSTLPAEVAEYMDALGLTLVGGYGLTEHLCAAFNRAERYTFDSVGPAMPGTTIRIAEDGEILLRRCELTFAGYRGRPDATREAFTLDGEWLRTGDLGALDDRGFLRITGRKKELIALSTGKKVAPVPIEARLTEHPWIAHAVLFGESRKFVTALLTLRRPVVEGWAREAGLSQPWPELVDHAAVRAGIQEAVDAVNDGLSRTERVRKFVVLDRELSLDEDELTPTLKVRRGMVTARFRDRLEALYAVTE